VDVDGTSGFVQLWLSVSEFNVLYDPKNAVDELGEHTFAFVSAESFMNKRKEKAERIATGEERAHIHVVMDETLSDNWENFWEDELSDTPDGKKELSVTCDGSCCGGVDSKTYFPRCLMEMRPVEDVDLEMVRLSTFFAQQHLDKELSNSLKRNLLYYFYYTTYFQLSRESSGSVAVGGRSRLSKCVEFAIKLEFPNLKGVEYVGFKEHSDQYMYW
jgi:hypothetical protein